MSQLKVAILCSSTRSFRGEMEDTATPKLKALAEAEGWSVVETCLLPDDSQQIEDWLKHACDELKVDLVLTTGGTGLGPYDVTPEATMAVVEREVPGITQALLQLSLQKTAHAMLSRAKAGVRGQTLIVNLPGSPKGMEECFGWIKSVLPHAVEVLRGGSAGHEAEPLL